MTHDAIIISPHLDDAVLSAGGRIYDLKRSGNRIIVITVFTLAARPPSVDAKKFLAASGGLSAQQLSKLRQKEDRRAMKRLEVDCLHLDFVEGLFRQSKDGNPIYPTFSQLFSGKISRDDAVVGDVEKSLKLTLKAITPRARIYAPLGVGDHVDHIITFNIVYKLFRTRVIFWEDIPYRTDSRKLFSRRAQLAKKDINLQKKLYYVKFPKEKERALKQYGSQLMGLHGAGLSDIDYHQEVFYYPATLS